MPSKDVQIEKFSIFSLQQKKMMIAFIKRLLILLIIVVMGYRWTANHIAPVYTGFRSSCPCRLLI